MKRKNPPDICGKKVRRVSVSDWDGAEATGVTIEFEDGSVLKCVEEYVEGVGWVQFNMTYS